MSVDDDCFEDFLLAREMVINTSQSKPGALGDLSHGCGVITLLEKETDGSIFDCQSRHFAFRVFFGFHGRSKNERTFVFILHNPGILSREKGQLSFL
jgi:hypothetical protein